MGRSDSGFEDKPKVTPEIAAEAAVWLVRLHGPDRNRVMEDEFRAWQSRSAAHREAFEKTTDVWQDVPGTQAAREYAASRARPAREAQPPARATGWRWATAAAAVLLTAGGALWLQHAREEGVYVTAVGEQRSVVLDDGTRMLLNTDTDLRVEYGPKQRTVEIRGGEALFEVAKDASRPFVVRVGNSEVVAVGTSFSVRFFDGPANDDRLSVTLIEGKVNVRPTHARVEGLAPKETVALKAGDRLTLDYEPRATAPAVETKVDRPNIERAMAWKRNEVAFDDTPLAGAIAEINRYSRTQVTLSKEVQAERLHVSGVYRTGDSAAFARAVAVLHGLKVSGGDGRLEIEKNR